MTASRSWKIRAPGDHRSLTEVPFAEGDVVYSCLVDSGDGDVLHREDYSEAAWLQVRSQQTPFSFWRSTFESKSGPGRDRPGPFQANDAEPLLQQLMEQGDPATEKTRYVLALMLERKKILHEVGRERQGAQLLLIYEHVFTGEVLIVPDPGISLEQMAAVERDVRNWLEAAGECEIRNAGNTPLASSSTEPLA